MRQRESLFTFYKYKPYPWALRSGPYILLSVGTWRCVASERSSQQREMSCAFYSTIPVQ